MLEVCYQVVWSFPVLLLIVGVSLFFTLYLGFVQFRYLLRGLYLSFFAADEDRGKGDISSFESLMCTLAATIGTGNIAGVATAISIGGFGSVFWMWVTALLGMATRFAESTLAVKYREVDKTGQMCGGPMYFLEKGSNLKGLAICFAFFGILASFGGGNMLQSSTVAASINLFLPLPVWMIGCALFLLVSCSILGGIQSIGKVTGILVPFMALLYVISSCFVISHHYELIPTIFWRIFEEAFQFSAVGGGIAGTAVSTALQVGIARGLMTSEAGLGTASIAAAAAKTRLPARQAIVSMTACFLATVIMCTFTAFVIGVTGVLDVASTSEIPLSGAMLTFQAFQSAIPFGEIFLSVAVILFGFTTILGWAYYGEKCFEYLFGERFIFLFRIIFSLMVIPGAILQLEVVLKISDIANILMAIPNLIGIALLYPQVGSELKKLEEQLQTQEAV